VKALRREEVETIASSAKEFQVTANPSLPLSHFVVVSLFSRFVLLDEEELDEVWRSGQIR
jgi:hypothetical protein